MSKMAMMWVAIYGGGLLGALKHPIYPMVAYLTFYYLPPHLNWWGKPFPVLRYSLIASLALAASVLFFRSNMEPVKEERNPALAWFVAYTANTMVVMGWALDSARSWLFSVVVLKLLLLYVLIPAAIRTPVHYEIFSAVHVAGAAYWGYKSFDDPKREAGRLVDVGGPDTQSDNQAAGHLVTVIPFVFLYVLAEKNKYLRAFYVVAGALVANVFILCNSRGATVGLVVCGLSAILLAGKGRRLKIIGAAALSALVMLYVADPEFIERQQTSMDPQDGAATGRFVMWRAGLEVVKDYPFGGGGRTFHILSPRYIPDIVAEHRGNERSPHNTFVQLATDWGIQGFTLFMGFLFATMYLLHRIRKRTPSNSWYVYRSLTIQIALIGTMAAGMFSSRLYGESIYWMCALAFALHRIQSTELEKSAVDAAPPGVATPKVLDRIDFTGVRASA